MELAVDDQPTPHAGRPRDEDHVAGAAARPRWNSPRPAMSASLATNAGAPVALLSIAARGTLRHPGRFGGLTRTPRSTSIGPGCADRDAAQLLAASVPLDLHRRPVDHPLRAAEQWCGCLEAGDQLAVGARQGNPHLRPAKVDSRQHVQWTVALRLRIRTRSAVGLGVPPRSRSALWHD